MALQAKCARCQGVFPNFRQTVECNGATYCTQCAAAIADGARPKMYSHELITHNIFESPSEQIAREDSLVRDRPEVFGLTQGA